MCSWSSANCIHISTSIASRLIIFSTIRFGGTSSQSTCVSGKYWTRILRNWVKILRFLDVRSKKNYVGKRHEWFAILIMYVLNLLPRGQLLSVSLPISAQSSSFVKLSTIFTHTLELVNSQNNNMVIIYCNYFYKLLSMWTLILIDAWIPGKAVLVIAVVSIFAKWRCQSTSTSLVCGNRTHKNLSHMSVCKKHVVWTHSRMLQGRYLYQCQLFHGRIVYVYKLIMMQEKAKR